MGAAAASVAGRRAKDALLFAGDVASSLAGQAARSMRIAASRAIESALAEALKKSFGPLWAKGIVESLGIQGRDFEGAICFAAPPAMANASSDDPELSGRANQMLFEILAEPFASGGHRLESASMAFDHSTLEAKLGLKLVWVGAPAAALADGFKPRKDRRIPGALDQGVEDVESREPGKPC